MNARYRLEKWLERLRAARETMKREDVCFVMVQARHLIEASEAPERFRVVSFYADWIVHTALDRSPVCFEVLRDISRVIAENMAPTSPETASLISRVIGFPQLRTQLMALFRENALPVTVFDYYQNWKEFGAFLLWHIAGQPVGWPAEPRGQAKVVREEMLALSRPHGVAVEAVAIVEHEGRYHWKLVLSQPDKTFFMVGAFDGMEGPDAFTPPPEA
jgi:hypothetical protein